MKELKKLYNSKYSFSLLIVGLSWIYICGVIQFFPIVGKKHLECGELALAILTTMFAGILVITVIVLILLIFCDIIDDWANSYD
jgi:hypothetical protein